MLKKIEELRKEGKIIGFTASCFDLMHPGHIAMLAEAKANCDFLIVGLLTDPTISRPDTKQKLFQSTFERFVQAQAVSYIDWLVPFDTEEDLEQMLMMFMPDVRFVGEEYKDIEHTGKHIPGIRIVYNKRKHNFSSTLLRNKILQHENI